MIVATDNGAILVHVQVNKGLFFFKVMIFRLNKCGDWEMNFNMLKTSM